MAVYDPTDPLNWRLIDAELRARNAGPNPDGTTRYDLPSMGMDPDFIAFQAQFDANRNNLGADRTLRRSRAQLDYEQALRDLEQQGLVSARATDTNMLARGVFNSGERTRRQNDLGLTLGEARGRADTTLADQLGSADADYERALTQLNLQREQAIVQSKSRITQAQRDGAEQAGLLSGAGTPAASGGGGAAPRPSAPAATRPMTQPLSSRPGTPGYVHDSIRPPMPGSTASSPPKPGAAIKPGDAKRTPQISKPSSNGRVFRY